MGLGEQEGTGRGKAWSFNGQRHALYQAHGPRDNGENGARIAPPQAGGCMLADLVQFGRWQTDKHSDLHCAEGFQRSGKGILGVTRLD